MTEDHDEHPTYAEWDGAYVLGALSPSERLEFERHMADCVVCRHSVAQLASLPGLLARVPDDDVPTLLAAGGLPETHEGETDRSAAEPHRGGHRRRLAIVGLSAAAATGAAAAATVAFVVPFGGSDDPRPGTPTDGTPAVSLDLQSRVSTPLTAEVSLTDTTWGTRVGMSCDYAAAEESRYAVEHAYALYVVTADGRRDLVSRWHAGPGETVRTEGATDLAVEEIVRVQVRDGSSDRLLLGAGVG